MKEIKDLKRYEILDSDSGVYFLYQGDEIVYVGQAMSVYSRVGVHKKTGEIAFDSFSFISLDIEEADAVESRYILELQPKHNSTVPLYVNITSLRNRVKAILGRNISMREFRKAILDLNVESHYFKGYQVYFKYADEEIADYLECINKAD